MASSEGEDAVALVDTLWVLAAAVGVFSMQPGFMLLEAGSVRARHVSSIVFKNVADALASSLIYWLFGYGLAFGTGSPVVGLSNFAVLDGGAVFFFQMAFACAAVTIVSGSVAERVHMSGYLLVSVLVSGLVYPLAAHWVWSDDGWLSRGSGNGSGLGTLDFGGGLVVHALGGVVALVGAAAVGPRHDFLDPVTGACAPPRGHSTVLTCLGAMVLAVCWIPFNAGSTLGLSGGLAAVASRAAVNTVLGGAAGGTVATVHARLYDDVVHVVPTVNGLLAGLVSVTSGAGYMPEWAALLTGAAGGLVYRLTSDALMRRFLDDPLEAAAIHGACGVWGAVAVGLLADGKFDSGAKGLVYGNAGQLGVQLVAAAAVVGWALVAGAASFVAAARLTGIRVSQDDQKLGLDVKLGGSAFPEWFAISDRLEAHEDSTLSQWVADPHGEGSGGRLVRFAQHLEHTLCLELLDFVLVVDRYRAFAREQLDDLFAARRSSGKVAAHRASRRRAARRSSSHASSAAAVAPAPAGFSSHSPPAAAGRKLSSSSGNFGPSDEAVSPPQFVRRAPSHGTSGATQVAEAVARTAEAARAVFDRYVAVGAQLQVNISSYHVAEISKKITALQGALHAGVPRAVQRSAAAGASAIFNAARNDLLHLLSQEPFHRFHEGEVRRQARINSEPTPFHVSDLWRWSRASAALHSGPGFAIDEVAWTVEWQHHDDDDDGLAPAPSVASAGGTATSGMASHTSTFHGKVLGPPV